MITGNTQAQVHENCIEVWCVIVLTFLAQVDQENDYSERNLPRTDERVV